MAVIRRTNLHINPRLLGATVGGTGSSGATDEQTGGPDGGAWRKVTMATDVASGDLHIGLNTIYAVPVEAGSTTPYQVSAAAFRSNGGQARVLVRRLDAAGAQVGGDVGSPLTTLAQGVWSTLSVVFDPAAAENATVATILVRVNFSGSRAAGEVLGASQVLIDHADTLGGYFDGDTPDTATRAYAWTGEANASTSTESVIEVPSGLPRTNLFKNPSFELGTTGVLRTAAILSTAREAAPSAAGSYSLEVTATDTPTAFTGVGQSFTVTAGQWVSTAYAVQPAGASYRYRVRSIAYGSSGTQVGASAYSDYVTVPADTWATVRGLNWQTPDGTVSVRAYLYVHALDSDTPPAGARYLTDAWIACAAATQSEAAAAVSPYFDGDTPDTDTEIYDWTDSPNASTSTATPVKGPAIIATVLTSSTVPPPVQLVLANIPDGAAYSVVGIAPGGRTWQVAGGYGTSEGVQIVLIDNRAPVNVPIRYRLVTPTGTYDSNTVTVPWTPDGSTAGKFLVQSLDGRTIVPIAAWNDNQLPKQPVLNTTGFDIRGRRRPVMVLATAGEGTMTVQWRLHRADSAKLDQIIADGGGIALRTDGTARDLPVSDVAVITSASNQLWAADNGVSTDRVWDLELTWIDDPEPSTIPVVWSVGDVDALLAGKTVAQVDALFAGMTVADVDTQDWGTLDA